MNEQYAAPTPLNEEVLTLARTLWEYHHMHHQLKKCDCILALGSHDLRVANRAAELWFEGWAPYIIFSGGLGNLTQGVWQEAEADQFAAIAVNMGVPKENILIENKSTNTGENIQFTKLLLAEKGLAPQKILLVQKPYMERRTYATVKKWWEEKDIIVTSPQFTFENYATVDIPSEKVIHIMVGDLQRIKEYPAKNFQIYQEIPAEVWQAYEQLVALGFTAHMIAETSN
ncbi:MAG: YdcF family protein [Flavitalea sp.]